MPPIPTVATSQTPGMEIRKAHSRAIRTALRISISGDKFPAGGKVLQGYSIYRDDAGLLRDLENAVEFLAQRRHILSDLIVGDFSIDLGRGNMFVPQHLADCLQRYALRERDRRGESMARHVDRGIERQTGMSGNLSQRHVQRLMGAFERKNLVSCQVHVLITFVEHFGNGKKFDTELHTRLLTLVDDPPLSVIVRMDVSMGKFHHLCMSQARKGAEDEDIPVDARPIVRELDIHHGLQFRSGQIATFGVFGPDMEPGERIDGNPAVLIRRIGHQLQFLDGRMNRPGTHTLYRGEIDHEFFDKIPFQLFERNILDVVFVFEEGGQTAAAFAVVLIAGIGAVLAYAFEEPCKVFVEGLQQQTAVVAHTEKSVADSFCRDIRIPVAETLVLLADIGLDVFQLLVETLGFETFTGSLVRLGIPKGRTDGEFAAELRHRAVDRDTTHNGNLTRFLGLPFHVEKDFESAALHDNLNFVDLLNVKSSYLLCGNSMQ